MSIPGILSAIESSSVPEAIRNSLYWFPLIEAFHVLGLAMVFGTIAVIDLRLLGIASTKRSFRRIASDVLKWTWASFGLTVVTGSLMFSTNAAVYYHNFFFRTKMVLLMLAGINMLVFELTAARTVHRWDNDAKAPLAGRTVAAISLVLWIAIIFLGRFTGFTTTGRPNVTAEPDDVNIENLLPQ
ncbi:MAG TPA: DUF6644 family protein [Terriglobia bacterium]|jgi:hypothetical protein